MKESGKATEVIVVTIGPAKAEEQLRTAMAIGADRGILVKTDAPTDLGGIEPLAVAKMLKALVEKEKPDLVIMGKQSIDAVFKPDGPDVSCDAWMAAGNIRVETEY